MALLDSNESYVLDKKGIIPAHIAIIMDGNGRWAKKRFMPRVYGHKEGMNTLKKVVIHAQERGVKVMTLYAFSTENWKRPMEEVSFLMNLPIDFFDIFMPDLIKNNIRITMIGNADELPEKTRAIIERAMERTKDHTGLILNFAMNYGGRDELLSAARTIAQEAVAGKLDPDDIRCDTISNHLATSFLGEYQDPDLVIRTSGEIRISNFLLWQIAYSELYFTEELWPDFSAESLDKAIATYQHRNRRFGGS